MKKVLWFHREFYVLAGWQRWETREVFLLAETETAWKIKYNFLFIPIILWIEKFTGFDKIEEIMEV